MKKSILIGLFVSLFFVQGFSHVEASSQCVGTARTVTVLAPNGGESFTEGQSIEVTWDTCNIPASEMVKIDLLVFRTGASTKEKVLSASTPNDGAEVFTLPTSLSWGEIARGEGYMVRVQRIIGPKVRDNSNANFTIRKRTMSIVSLNTPASQIVMVSNDTPTDDVALLKGRVVYAGGGSIVVNELPATLTTVGGESVAALTGSVKLVLENGAEYEEVVAINSSKTGTIVFDNLNIMMNSGDTRTFTVKANINPISPGTFDNGDSLVVDITGMNLKNIKAKTENGDDVALFGNDVLTIYKKVPALEGNPQIFRSEGAMLSMKNATVTPTTVGGVITEIQYNIPVELTAFGGDYYIGKTLTQSNVASGKNALAYVLETPNVPKGSAFGETTYSFSHISGATEEGDAYRLDEGTTARFNLVITLVNPFSPKNTYYRVAMKQIKLFGDSALSTGAMTIDLPRVDAYRTMSQLKNLYWN